MKTRSKQLELEIQESIDNTPLFQTLQKPYFDRYRNFNRLVEYFGTGNIPIQYLEEFKRDFRKDYILENLQTHDWKLLAKALEKFFGDNFVSASDGEMGKSRNGKDFCFITLKDTSNKSVQEIIKDIRKNREFLHILEFYNYSLSSIKRCTLQLEPIYSDSANDFVYGECHGIGYHITTKENAKYIEKLGLRCKTGRPREGQSKESFKSYREFPKRIYFIAFPSKVDNRLLGKVAVQKGIYPENLAVFKIYLSGEIYKDTATPEENNTFFTYTNIPPEHLKRIL